MTILANFAHKRAANVPNEVSESTYLLTKRVGQQSALQHGSLQSAGPLRAHNAQTFHHHIMPNTFSGDKVKVQPVSPARQTQQQATGLWGTKP